jgi:putative lipoprotein
VKSAFPCVLGLLLTATDVRADDWVGPDKGLHFGASAGLSVLGHALALPLLESPLERATFGLIGSLALGLAKEFVDGVGLGTASFKDVTWNLAGAVTGALLAWTIDTFLVTPWLEQLAPRVVF